MAINQAKVLSRMKKLIKEGKRRFQLRKDRDYMADLLELGLSENEAWNYILTNININFIVNDPKPTYSKSGEALVFKRPVNGIDAYIKLKIEKGKIMKMKLFVYLFIKVIGGIKYEM